MPHESTGPPVASDHYTRPAFEFCDSAQTTKGVSRQPAIRAFYETPGNIEDFQPPKDASMDQDETQADLLDKEISFNFNELAESSHFRQDESNKFNF